MAMGFALSGFAKSSEGYSAFSNAAFFPLLFLSGVYFPMDTAPRWAQQIPGLLPLSPCLRILRAIFDGGAGLAHLGAALGVVVAWTGVCSGLALLRFRWA
jgi:ABC-2 type transport system permease protein